MGKGAPVLVSCGGPRMKDRLSNVCSSSRLRCLQQIIRCSCLIPCSVWLFCWTWDDGGLAYLHSSICIGCLVFATYLRHFATLISLPVEDIDKPFASFYFEVLYL